MINTCISTIPEDNMPSTQENISQRRYSTESTTSYLSSDSPDSPLNILTARPSGETIIPEFFDPTYTFPPNLGSRKPGVKVMKAGYSRVKKTTTSMFKAKTRPVNAYLTANTPLDKGTTFSIAELDARLKMLDKTNQHLEVPSIPIPLPNHASLVPPYPTPRWDEEAPLWPEASSGENHPDPGTLTAKSWTEQASLYFAAEFIAIPSMALSWRPMTIAIILASSIAILCGYRYVIAIPVLMLLNPASPLWRNGDTREKGNDVLIIPSPNSPDFQATHHKVGSHHSHHRRRPIPPTRRHSTAI